MKNHGYVSIGHILSIEMSSISSNVISKLDHEAQLEKIKEKLNEYKKLHQKLGCMHVNPIPMKGF